MILQHWLFSIWKHWTSFTFFSVEHSKHGDSCVSWRFQSGRVFSLVGGRMPHENDRPLDAGGSSQRWLYCVESRALVERKPFHCWFSIAFSILISKICRIKLVVESLGTHENELPLDAECSSQRRHWLGNCQTSGVSLGWPFERTRMNLPLDAGCLSWKVTQHNLQDYWMPLAKRPFHFHWFQLGFIDVVATALMACCANWRTRMNSDWTRDVHLSNELDVCWTCAGDENEPHWTRKFISAKRPLSVHRSRFESARILIIFSNCFEDLMVENEPIVRCGVHLR